MLGMTELERVADRGERHLPVLNPESGNHYRHLTAYHFALPFCRGRSVLDYGCGTGYGTNLVFRRGKPERLLAMDVSPEAVAYCQRSYCDLAGCFSVVPPGVVPEQDDSVDVALLFQTLEHVSEDAGLLLELRRVLRPAGILLITTPNVTWTGGDPQRPGNPHHVREYDVDSLQAACLGAFRSVQVLFVHGSFRVGGGGVGAERWVAYRALRKVARPVCPVPLYSPPVSLADFRINRKGARRALDLLAVCRM
jgi:SAM-dependent methyltransferase